MVYFLYTLFFISCVALIFSVLLQPGKTDAGALFTSNISSTAFQPRGAQTILSKITIVAACVFMLSALLLAMPSLNGGVSVLETVGGTTETAPAMDANANVDANANQAIDTNTNTAVNPANAVAPTNVEVNSAVNTETNSTVVQPSNTNAADK